MVVFLLRTVKLGYGSRPRYYPSKKRAKKLQTRQLTQLTVDMLGVWLHRGIYPAPSQNMMTSVRHLMLRTMQTPGTDPEAVEVEVSLEEKQNREILGKLRKIIGRRN